MLQRLFLFTKNHLPILIIIVILALYLGIKAADETGWDGWGFGSAQTLMSSQYWARDGFAKNYFLFIAQPYSKLIHYFDEPEFLNRPIDNSGGALARDRRLYYTHYPPLYLFPYAIMAKFGIESRAIFRIFSLLVSLIGLVFFYLFIKSVSNNTVAAIASVYYGFSVNFINYADSISVQPWDISFIFLILYLNVLAWRNFDNQEKYQKYNFYIWPAYLALSLLSYDATFFIFAYFILFDIFVLKRFLWKRWLFFALAPVLGFTLQIIQNTWYLGWEDMLNDFRRYYTERAVGSPKNFVLGLIAPFVTMPSIKTFYFFKKTLVALGSIILIFGILWKLRNKINLNYHFFKIVFVLAIAAIAQPFFLNVTGLWPFQGVLTAAFWGLLIGESSLITIETFKQKITLAYKEKVMIFVLSIIILMLWIFQFYNTWNYIKDWPNNKPNQKIIEFGKTLKTFYPNEERVAFRILPTNPIWKSQYGTFNMEYYFGMPKIDFANIKDLLVDFWWLKNRSEYPFYSFIVSENKNDAEKIRRELLKKNLKNISPIIDIQGQYLFTVGPK